MVHAYDEQNFATTVTGVATIQAWPGTVSANAPDRVFHITGLTYSGTSGNTVTLQSQGPFGTVTLDAVTLGGAPFARGYGGEDSDVVVLGAAQSLIASVVGTVSIAGIGRWEVGRQ